MIVCGGENAQGEKSPLANCSIMIADAIISSAPCAQFMRSVLECRWFTVKARRRGCVLRCLSVGGSRVTIVACVCSLGGDPPCLMLCLFMTVRLRASWPAPMLCSPCWSHSPLLRRCGSR